jgi:hypothetical protein
MGEKGMLQYCISREEHMAAETKFSTIKWLQQVLGLVLMIIIFMPASSWAHGFAGKRFFPTTLSI